MNRMPAVLFQWILWLALAVSTSVAAAPGTGRPLALSRGEVRRVKTVGELKTALEAANRAKVATTLLLEDGIYLLDVPALEIKCPGLVIRSSRGDRDAVIVRGPDEGTNAAVANVFLVSANDVVIADLTLGYCRHHGIQVRGEPPFHVSGLLRAQLPNCQLQPAIHQRFLERERSAWRDRRLHRTMRL